MKDGGALLTIPTILKIVGIVIPISYCGVAVGCGVVVGAGVPPPVVIDGLVATLFCRSCRLNRYGLLLGMRTILISGLSLSM